MIVEHYPQLSVEWFEARCGKPTASCFNKLITAKTMRPSSQATNYLYQLAGERITGAKTETYQNAAMERGMVLEAEARSLFEMVMDVEVQEAGLVYPDEEKKFSCSPDGLMEDAGLEIKCPLVHTHVSYLLANVVPPDYIPQVQGSMLVTGFSHYYFMSYYPGLAPLIIDVPRDEKFCAALKVELESFCEKLDEIEAKLRKLE